jgi:hypothetical protein
MKGVVQKWLTRPLAAAAISQTCAPVVSETRRSPVAQINTSVRRTKKGEDVLHPPQLRVRQRSAPQRHAPHQRE